MKPIGLLLTLAMLAISAVLTLTGCNSSPCAGHGHVVGYVSGWAKCSDGTFQSAT